MPGPDRGMLSYPEVGATAGDLPVGYHHLRRSRTLGVGERCFVEAARRLMTWEMHRRAGVRVATETPVPAVGVLVPMCLGIGSHGIDAECLVVDVVDDARARGFTYGTLPGHPEVGEERFCVEWRDDDTVVASIVAFSRPGRWFTRIGGPVARGVQRVITDRYLAALVCA